MDLWQPPDFIFHSYFTQFLRHCFVLFSYFSFHYFQWKYPMQNFCLFAACFSVSHAGISPVLFLLFMFSSFFSTPHSSESFFFFDPGAVLFAGLCVCLLCFFGLVCKLICLFFPTFLPVLLWFFIISFFSVIWSCSCTAPLSIFLEYSCLSVYFFASFFPSYQTEELT